MYSKPCHINYSLLSHNASHFITERLSRRDFSFITLCWLIPVIFMSFIGLEVVSKRVCTITFPGIKVMLSSLKRGVIFAFLQNSRTSLGRHELLKALKSGLVMILAGSLSSCGCIPLCPSIGLSTGSLKGL